MSDFPVSDCFELFLHRGFYSWDIKENNSIWLIEFQIPPYDDDMYQSCSVTSLEVDCQGVSICRWIRQLTPWDFRGEELRSDNLKFDKTRVQLLTPKKLCTILLPHVSRGKKANRRGEAWPKVEHFLLAPEGALEVEHPINQSCWANQLSARLRPLCPGVSDTRAKAFPHPDNSHLINFQIFMLFLSKDVVN